MRKVWQHKLETEVAPQKNTTFCGCKAPSDLRGNMERWKHWIGWTIATIAPTPMIGVVGSSPHFDHFALNSPRTLRSQTQVTQTASRPSMPSASRRPGTDTAGNEFSLKKNEWKWYSAISYIHHEKLDFSQQINVETLGTIFKVPYNARCFVLQAKCLAGARIAWNLNAESNKNTNHPKTKGLRICSCCSYYLGKYPVHPTT